MKKFAWEFDHLQDPVTLIIMITALLLYITCLANDRIRFKLILHPQSIIFNKEYYRLLTADFIHNDWLHLMLNEFFLYVYAGYLENYLNERMPEGSLVFLLIYTVSCLAGTASIALIERRNFEFTSAGASASMMGCLFSYLLLQPKRIAFVMPVLGGITNLYFGLIFIVGLIIYERQGKNSLINHAQHLISGIAGMAITLALFPAIIK